VRLSKLRSIGQTKQTTPKVQSERESGSSKTYKRKQGVTITKKRRITGGKRGKRKATTIEGIYRNKSLKKEEKQKKKKKKKKAEEGNNNTKTLRKYNT